MCHFSIVFSTYMYHIIHVSIFYPIIIFLSFLTNIGFFSFDCQNKDLSQDAILVKAFRDQIDVLKVKVSHSQMFVKDVHVKCNRNYKSF